VLVCIRGTPGLLPYTRRVYPSLYLISWCRSVENQLEFKMSDPAKPYSSVPSAAGPLALPWRMASIDAHDTRPLGLTPDPLQVEGSSAVLKATGARGCLTIDGRSVSFAKKGENVSLSTRDVLGAKVCCLIVVA
jgi:hypothetical protein